MTEPYALAQRAVADLKTAVYLLLQRGPKSGMRNVDIGRALGIHAGHVEHVGHIPRTLLALMKKEGVVQQDLPTKLWTLCQNTESAGATADPDVPSDNSDV